MLGGQEGAVHPEVGDDGTWSCFEVGNGADLPEHGKDLGIRADGELCASQPGIPNTDRNVKDLSGSGNSCNGIMKEVMGLLPSASRMLDLVPAPEFVGLRCVEGEQSRRSLDMCSMRMI